MQTYTVTRLIENDHAYTNSVYFNTADKMSNYCKINYAVYPVLYHDAITKGTVGISSILRAKMEVQTGNKVHVTPFQPNHSTLSHLIFNVKLKESKRICEHEDDIRDVFVHTFKHFYFHYNQYLVMKYKDCTLYMTMKS